MACVTNRTDCYVIGKLIYEERVLTSCAQIGVTCVKGTRMELKQTSCTSELQHNVTGPLWVGCTSSYVGTGRCCTTSSG